MPIKIDSEETAIAVLEKALNGKLDDEEDYLLDFSGWPRVGVYLPKTPISGSISPTMMEAFIELQKTIYRAYTIIESDTADLRTLSKEEHDHLEFRVKVSNGSSEYDADLGKALEKILVEAMSHMTSHDIVITILGIALILGGVVSFKAWLSNRAEQRKAELDSADKKDWLEAQKTMFATNTEHLRILAEATVRKPVLADVDALAEPARTKLIRAVGEEGGGRVYDAQITREVASELTAQKRQQGDPIRLAGIYTVVKNDTTNADGFRVTLSDTQTGQEITAFFQDVMISAEYRLVIQKAEWDRKPFYAEIAARRIGTRIVDAIIMMAREQERTES